MKTAVLRAVSHDLRTPVTAIVAAGHALGSDSLTAGERTELSAAVVEEGEQLAALVDKLLDLSRLQAGRAEPRRDWVSLEDVVLAARDGLPDPAERCGSRSNPTCRRSGPTRPSSSARSPTCWRTRCATRAACPSR